MEMAEKIKNRRTELNLTLENIAKVVGVSKATVQRWESGAISNMRRDKIANLAKALQTTPAYLMGWTNTPEPPPPLPKNLVPLKKVHYIPLIGRIACGAPIFAEENIIERIILPDGVNANYALVCQGESMIDAGIDNGDLVFIRQQPEVENGEIAAVLIGEEATLKKVYFNGEKLSLIPANSACEPYIYVGNEINEVRILGKAVAVLKNIE